MPLTILNLSRVDHLYIGKDTVIALSDQSEFDTYNVESASEEQIKEHLAQPRNWVPQRHETLPEIPSDTAFICSPADVPGHRKVHLQDKDISGNIHQRFEEPCDEYGQAFSKHIKDIGRREDYVLISEKSMNYNSRSQQKENPKVGFPFIHYQRSMRCMQS